MPPMHGGVKRQPPDELHAHIFVNAVSDLTQNLAKVRTKKDIPILPLSEEQREMEKTNQEQEVQIKARIESLKIENTKYCEDVVEICAEIEELEHALKTLETELTTAKSFTAATAGSKELKDIALANHENVMAMNKERALTRTLTESVKALHAQLGQEKPVSVPASKPWTQKKSDLRRAEAERVFIDNNDESKLQLRIRTQLKKNEEVRGRLQEEVSRSARAQQHLALIKQALQKEVGSGVLAEDGLGINSEQLGQMKQRSEELTLLRAKVSEYENKLQQLADQYPDSALSFVADGGVFGTGTGGSSSSPTKSSVQVDRSSVDWAQRNFEGIIQQRADKASSLAGNDRCNQ